jgi:NAD(P)-dependent dehydrogenase (short-subunit alcohol dehydrogenase family)
MRERGRGAIVNVSSFGGQAPFPGIGAYRSSKFAVEGLSWTLHLEVAHFGIRVLVVQPGLTETEFEPSMRFAPRLEAYEEMRASGDRAYPRMSPTAMPPAQIAAAIVAELREGERPLRLRVGEDTERVIGVVERGQEAYERFLVEELGFDWHPLREAVA